MRPAYEADGIILYCGDAREVMRWLPRESVSCCVTSPPFWGLRKYDGPDTIWGGSPDCEHQAWVKQTNRAEKGNTIGLNGPVQKEEIPPAEHATCSLCGAWRGQLGLEPTVDLFVAHTIEWMRDVKRVLRKDGCFWLDIDDSRGNSSEGGFKHSSLPHDSRKTAYRPESMARLTRKRSTPPKSLCLIPQRIALAAAEDGWIVRSQIIIPTWMPESARDRPTDACRTVLMLVKSPRYWYDGLAVRVPSSLPMQRISGYEPIAEERWMSRTPNFSSDGLRNLGNVWDDLPPSSSALPGEHFASFPIEEPLRCLQASCPPDGTALDPFVGTGTTAVAARMLGRRCIGIDVSERYIQQAIKRLTLGDKAMRRLGETRRRGLEQGILL